MSEQREITVNAYDCNECMGCLDLAPDIFAWDDATCRIVLKKSEVDVEEVREAMASCPRECITYVDD